MKEFTFLLSSPDGELFRGEVTMISLRGTEGSLAIMAGHIPFLTAVVPCDCTITLENGTEKVAELDGGLLTVSGTEATLLSSGVKWKE
ncbi:MAG: F0F1 ATP synthase subunit epsilon [Clostridia bacterium]|nr:F0F1 ATP synthase subunit epsilon [Clostridia bacterium]